MCGFRAARVLVLVGVTFTLALTSAGLARANETITSCGLAPNEVFGHAAVFGISTNQNCGNSTAYLDIVTNGNTVAAGQHASWQATAPPGLVIDTATVPSTTPDHVNNGTQYGGGFYWSGGGEQFYNHTADEGLHIFGVANNTPGFPSPYFGFQLVCGANPCTTGVPSVTIPEVILDVAETTGPTLLNGKLWAQHGWVRGDWPLLVNGDSPSGLCSLSASVDAQLVASQSFPRDTSAWHQCDAAGAGGLNTTVHTTQFSNASHTLTASGGDAAGLSATPATTINVDNQTPAVTLSGPTDAPSTAGTQYVTATATAGPSGVNAIACSVDGAPSQSYAGASARVPVNGIGEHSVSCTASNNALDASGTRASSPVASFAVKIGVPTVSAISFSKLVGLHCHRVRERVKVVARWVTVRRHHRPVRIRRRARTKRITVVRCHAQTKLRRVTVLVRVRRHGHRVLVRRHRLERVVIAPHTVSKSTLRVAHGHGTTVSGFLGTTGLTALAGQQVQVLTAPELPARPYDAVGPFTQAAVVTTDANGLWSARLPAGPSRLVMASYAGGPSTEGNSSTPVNLIVPARIRLLSVTRRVPWGGTVRIVGQLHGGYLPPGGALIRLRYGHGTASTTYGVREHVTGTGRFSTSYTFGLGDPRVIIPFFFEVATLSEPGYPYAPAASQRLTVRVGGHPLPPSKRKHHRRVRHRKHR